MSPKIILWIVFSLVSSTWYALDPEAGGPLFGKPPPTVTAAVLGPPRVPRLAGN